MILDAIAQIKKWVDDSNKKYSDGVGLYCQFGIFESWKIEFQRRPNTRENLKLLVLHLKKSVEKFQENKFDNPGQPIKLVHPVARLVQPKLVAVDAQNETKVAEAVIPSAKEKNWKTSYKILANRHATMIPLLRMNEWNELEKVRDEILLRSKEIAKIQSEILKEKIDGVQIDGGITAPENELTKVDITNQALVQKRITTLRTYQSRTKNNLAEAEKKLTDAEIKGEPNQVAKCKNRIEEILKKQVAFTNEINYLESVDK